MSKTEEKSESLSEVITSIEKQHGSGSIMYLGSKKFVPMDVIPTGSLALDEALGVGGLPRGRVVEAFGVESGGKSTLALLVIAEAQKLGGKAAFIDAEHALDPVYARKLGVDVDHLLISQPDNGEQALEIAESLIKSGKIAIVVVDSVAALVPKAELEGDMGDSVIYETPIYIRNARTKLVQIVSIGDLHKKHQTGWYRKFNRTQILTHKGWKNLLGVQKKKNTNKSLIYTRTSTGYVGTTKDHSLFVNGKEVSPKELRVFDRLDVYEKDIESGLCDMIPADVAWLLGFYVAEGSTPRTRNFLRFEVCNTEQHLIDKCCEIIKKRFGLDADRRTIKTTEGRKELSVLAANSDNILGALMQACISDGNAKTVPMFILNGTESTQSAFLDGFWQGDGSHSNPDKSRKYYNNSWTVMAAVQFLEARTGMRTNVVVNNFRLNQLALSQNPGREMRRKNEIVQFYEAPAPEFWYDVCTEVGTFVVALGNIICHNSQMGLQARLMSQAMRKLTGITNQTKTVLFFINQIREKIGVMFGNPETTTGGRALKFYASVRLDIRRTGAIKDGDKTIGAETRIRVVKNKCASPFKEANVQLIYGEGISKEADLLNIGITRNTIEKSGSWLSYNGERIGQGFENARKFLLEHSDISGKIEAELRDIIFKKG